MLLPPYIPCQDWLYPETVNQNEPFLPWVPLARYFVTAVIKITGTVTPTLMALSSRPNHPQRPYLGAGYICSSWDLKSYRASSREACLLSPSWPASGQPSSEHERPEKTAISSDTQGSAGKTKLPCEQCWTLSWLWGGRLHNSNSQMPFLHHLPPTARLVILSQTYYTVFFKERPV